KATADALAVLPGLRRLQVVEVQLLGHYCSIFTRWLTFRSMPASTGLSSCSTVRPILPRPSARSVPRCGRLWPIWLRTCVIRTLATLLLSRSGGSPPVPPRPPPPPPPPGGGGRGGAGRPPPPPALFLWQLPHPLSAPPRAAPPGA